jgi:hypothetical protein
MKQQVNEEVSVYWYYQASKKKTVLHRLGWQNKDYELGNVDYYHTYMDGQTKLHVFELCDKQETIWFRLVLNGSNLHWTLEAIHDGNAD